MTREEMIKELKTVYLGDSIKMREAKNMAVKALEQEPCEDCISRQAAINAAIEAADEWDGGGNRNREEIIEKALEQLPSVTPQPKMGRWIMPQMDDGMSDPVVYQVRCSVCKWDVDPQTWYEELAHAFCPNCGAKLEVGNG